LRRFLRVAVAKQAQLVVFPELGGMMVAPPILGDFRSTLLKRADRGRRRHATLWQRMSGAVAGALAASLRADFRMGVASLLDVAAADLWQAYTEVFGGLAREFGVVVAAPSAYLPDPVDGVIRNLAGVFTADGELAGRQAKVVLHPEDVDLAQPGATWDAIQTEVGRLGLILGSDVLYPEVGRVLAYQGADVLVSQAACTDVVLYNKIRAGVLARMQDNQLFAVASFLVGENRLGRGPRTPYVGKSAIFAPQELTPRANGVLVEMGNPHSEGVVAAPWDFPALKQLWESSDTPVRRQLPLAQAGQVLAQLYARLQALPRVMEPLQLAADATIGESVTGRWKDSWSDVIELDDLAVVSTVTSRWPPTLEQRPRSDPFTADELAPEPSQDEPAQEQAAILDDIDDDIDAVVDDSRAQELSNKRSSELDAALPVQVELDNPATAGHNQTGSLPTKTEDETDEMDVVAKTSDSRE
jgi:predicted amidohydrolase